MLSDGQLNYSNKDLIKIGEDKSELEFNIATAQERISKLKQKKLLETEFCRRGDNANTMIE
jgi:hypothetical protein